VISFVVNKVEKGVAERGGGRYTDMDTGERARMLHSVRAYFGNPNNCFYWVDMALVIVVYGLSIALFLNRNRGYIAPLLIFGIFLFPVQFSIWFLASKVNVVFFPNPGFFEVFYLFFLKACLIATFLAPKTGK
jgi:hypothetical protein